MNNDFNNDELHFHYKREDRIKNEPDFVQSHGIFKSLVATKSSRFLLGGIVLLLVMIFFAKNIDKISQPSTLEGIAIDLSAFSFDSTVYVTAIAKETTIEKEIPITACFNAKNSNNAIVKSTTIYSIFDGKELSLESTFEKNDIMTIECHISTETDSIVLKTKVQ